MSSEDIKMTVMLALQTGAIDVPVEKNLELCTEILADASNSYSLLSKTFTQGRSYTRLKLKADKLLPWDHTMITRAKRQRFATYN